MFVGPVLQDCCSAISDAFANNVNALEQALDFKLGKKLFNLVAPNVALNTVVYNLVTLSIQEGWIRSLVFAVVLVRPDNAQMKAFCTAHAPWAFKPPEPGELISQVTSGIDAVTARLADPVVQAVVFEYGDDLRAARDGVKLLHKYKELHDQLHTIQLMFARTIEGAAKFAKDGMPIMVALDFIALQLREHAEKAEQRGRELPTYPLESWWAKTLTQIAGMIEQQPPKAAELERAVILLRGVLAESGRINSKMTEIVAGLRLDGLVEAMRKVADHLAGANGAQEIQAAVAGLIEIGPRIEGLMREHDEWQSLDRDFTMAENMTATYADVPSFTVEDRIRGWKGVKEPPPGWKGVSDKLADLCDLSAKKPWVTLLQKQITEMTAAAEPMDKARFERAFNTFLDVARNRFVNVDTELLNQSRALAEIAPALAELVP